MDLMRKKVHLVKYCGQTIETTVTNDNLAADKWVSRVLEDQKGEKNIIVGFDCKYHKPHPIRSMTSNKLATLQLCVGNNCLILQLLHMEAGIPQSVVNLLNDAKVTLFGVEIKENVLKLQKEYKMNININYCGGSPQISSNVVDIRALAKTWFPLTCTNTCSLKGIAYQVAGLSMRKSSKPRCFNIVGFNDWEATVLSQDLIAYAAVDAYVFYVIPHTLLHHM